VKLVKNTIDMFWLELRAEIDLTAEIRAVDKDEVCVMRVEEAVVRHTALLLSSIIDRLQNW